jgi:hypothetical protein
MSPLPAPELATYVYCLVRSRQPPALAGIPGGLAGAAAPELLAVGDQLWLVVAAVPLRQYSAAALEARLQDLSWVSSCAVAHEAVIEHFLDAEAVVPMKLFTLFRSPRRAVEHVAAERSQLQEILRRVAGCREWGVRVRARPGAGGTIEPSTAPAGSGREFLLRKSRVRQQAREAGARAHEAAELAWQELQQSASEARRRPLGPAETTARLLLDATFLVAVATGEDFEAAIGGCAERLSQAGCELALTGPWPPYSFVADLS